MRFLVGDSVVFNGLVGDVVEQVEPCFSLLRFPGLELVGKKLMQPQYSAVGAYYVLKAVDLLGGCVWDRDLVERGFDEVAQSV